ncbi:hypothetical protein SDC9_180869 [bioreactor metagenome]|uniref:Uncharacterized protein n=1 Tax=bioreactor metagenome TaxID=1076179 RepID=A0A645HC60_9ZZZZ
MGGNVQNVGMVSLLDQVQQIFHADSFHNPGGCRFEVVQKNVGNSRLSSQKMILRSGIVSQYSPKLRL